MFKITEMNRHTINSIKFLVCTELLLCNGYSDIFGAGLSQQFMP